MYLIPLPPSCWLNCQTERRHISRLLFSFLNLLQDSEHQHPAGDHQWRLQRRSSALPRGHFSWCSDAAGHNSEASEKTKHPAAAACFQLDAAGSERGRQVEPSGSWNTPNMSLNLENKTLSPSNRIHPMSSYHDEDRKTPNQDGKVFYEEFGSDRTWLACWVKLLKAEHSKQKLLKGEGEVLRAPAVFSSD